MVPRVFRRFGHSGVHIPKCCNFEAAFFVIPERILDAGYHECSNHVMDRLFLIDQLAEASRKLLERSRELRGIARLAIPWSGSVFKPDDSAVQCDSATPC